MAEISLTGDQMLAVLEAVAKDGPMTAAEVARMCNINRTVAYRLLATLAARAYVRRSDGGYTVGPSVLKLVQTLDLDLRSIAKPVMTKLAQNVGETVVLHAIDNLEAVVIDQALGQNHLLRVEHTPGLRHSLTKGASGWSLLAFQGDKFIERFLKKTDDPASIKRRIEETRAAGFSVSHDELQMGVHGVAAPILQNGNRCQASLAILVPVSRAEQLKGYVPALLAASAEISARLR